MEKGASDQPASGIAAAITNASPLRRGFWVGAIFAAGAVASAPILEALSYTLDRPGLDDRILGSMLAILVIGYLAGLATATKRQTRHLGLGILVGVTVAFPALVMLSVGVLFALFPLAEALGFGGG